MENIKNEIAIKHYQKHLEAQRRHYAKNQEKINGRNKGYYNRLKEEDPDKFEKLKEYRRLYQCQLRQKRRKDKEELENNIINI